MSYHKVLTIRYKALKMDMYTKIGDVAVSAVGIWAVPTKEYNNGDWQNTGFQYQLHTGNPYVTGSVKVGEQQVTLQVPSGVNLLQAAIETVQKAKKDLLASYLDSEAELNKQISDLQQLGYDKPDDVIEAYVDDDNIFNIHEDAVITAENLEAREQYDTDEDIQPPPF
jgi:mRNA-degrading endonuclease HigB of HigAB toxin-antitoxin module